jgi:hypothetical protein
LAHAKTEQPSKHTPLGLSRAKSSSPSGQPVLVRSTSAKARVLIYTHLSAKMQLFEANPAIQNTPEASIVKNINY